MKRRFVLTVFLGVLVTAGASLAATARDIVLSADCPPGFELTTGHCELRSL